MYTAFNFEFFQKIQSNQSIEMTTERKIFSNGSKRSLHKKYKTSDLSSSTSKLILLCVIPEYIYRSGLAGMILVLILYFNVKFIHQWFLSLANFSTKAEGTKIYT